MKKKVLTIITLPILKLQSRSFKGWDDSHETKKSTV